MGGFFGRAGRAPVDDSELKRLDAALDSLTHRGPDGRFTRAWKGHYLGARTGAGEGEQPCQSGDWEVLFDGALQNQAALSQRLGQGGTPQPSRTDAELAAAWVAAYGPAGLPDLHGMFAIAAVNRKTGDAWLARDRFGVVPLYYTQVENRLVFASEPRALRVANVVPQAFDSQAVASFLGLGQPFSEQTFFQGIHRVQPGSYVRWQGETASMGSTTWYRWPEGVTDMPVLAGNEQERDASLETLLQDIAAETMLHSDVSGVLVNADIGSALLSYYAVQAARAIGRAVPVLFTMGLPDTSAEQDAAHAIDTARHVGAPHTVVDYDINAPFDFELLARAFDEPCGDVSSYLFTVMGRLAREHGTHWLTGNGATSAYLGASHQLASMRATASPWNATLHALAKQGKTFATPFSPLRRKLDRATLPASLLPLSFTTLTHSSAMRHILTAEAREHVDRSLDHLLQAAATWPEPHTPAQLRTMDLSLLHPARQMLKVDRTAHAFGMQYRPLWYDARLLSHAATLPEGDLLSEGMGAQPLRRLVKKRLPLSVATLQRGPAAVSFKRVFGAAHDRSLLARVHETPAVRAWIEPEKLQELLKAWRQSPTNHLDGTVWRCVALAVWMERWNRA